MTITDQITLSALLLSEDAGLIDVIRDVAGNMQLEIEICGELAQAARKVAVTKFQGVMLDWNQDVGAPALLKAVRASTSNSSDVVFAFISNGDQALTATRLGANFIIPRPATPESIGPHIRAGYRLMVHELRRYFRCRVVLPIQLVRRDGERWPARPLNVSRGGRSPTPKLPTPLRRRFGPRRSCFPCFGRLTPTRPPCGCAASTSSCAGRSAHR